MLNQTALKRIELSRMTNRKKSRIAFIYAVITAVTVTCIFLYSLMAGLARSQSVLLLIGCLIVVWAIVFSFVEVRRLAAGPHSSDKELVDPDGPRRIIVEPPTGEPYPHHEQHAGSPGQDQGQLTSRLPDDTPTLGKLFRRHS
jgi:hypothetical protein